MPEQRLVDTSVLSLIIKRDTRATLYVPHLVDRVGILSFITLAELYCWPEERHWSLRRRAELLRFLQPYAIVYPDDALCQLWALLMAGTRRSGRTLPFADSWIAATALQLDLPLVTHNPVDFQGTDGLIVISAASATPPYIAVVSAASLSHTAGPREWRFA